MITAKPPKRANALPEAIGARLLMISNTPQPDPQMAISARELTKSFHSRSGRVHALRGVSLDVPPESVFTILGPNGAGKTTLLRILTSVMRPSSGHAWLNGFELGRHNIDIRQQIGIVAQDNHFDRYLTVWQNLFVHADMHGLSPEHANRRIRSLLEKVNLYDRRNDFLEQFSGGMQRRVALIRALIHEPKILFLDEPSTGLDPAARREIWQTILDLKQRTTVILTTHYMDEADRLSDQIMMLNHGQVVMVGTPQALKQQISPPGTYELVLATPRATHYAEQLGPRLQELHVAPQDPHLMVFKLATPDQLPQVLAQVAPEDFQSIGRVQADLEAVYLRVAGQTHSPNPNPEGPGPS